MESHRLFVGFPIAADAALNIRGWAEEKYQDYDVKLVPTHHLHVTLLFYPSVSNERKKWMAGLIQRVDLPSMEAVSFRTVKLGMSALALELSVPAIGRQIWNVNC